MSATTAHRPQRVTFQSPAESLRQSTLKKNTMSITQTYYLAHKARSKLSREAARSDHDLRLLVGHANLLDTLMVELADAEREQERWFNQSVRGAEKEDRHIQFSDRLSQVSEEDEEEYSESESESDSEVEDDDEFDMIPALHPSPSKPTVEAAPVKIQSHAARDEVMEDNLEEDYTQLELVRTPSHSNSPPELVDESDESDDDEAMPPAPRTPTDIVMSLPGKEAGKASTELEEPMYGDSYYLSSARQSNPIPVC